MECHSYLLPVSPEGSLFDSFGNVAGTSDGHIDWKYYFRFREKFELVKEWALKEVEMEEDRGNKNKKKDPRKKKQVHKKKDLEGTEVIRVGDMSPDIILELVKLLPKVLLFGQEHGEVVRRINNSILSTFFSCSLNFQLNF